MDGKSGEENQQQINAACKVENINDTNGRKISSPALFLHSNRKQIGNGSNNNNDNKRKSSGTLANSFLAEAIWDHVAMVWWAKKKNMTY